MLLAHSGGAVAPAEGVGLLWIQVKAIFRKEVREASRTMWSYFGMTMLYATFLQWFIIRNYVAMLEATEKNEQIAAAFGASSDALLLAASFSLVFVAPMVMPFFANAMMTKAVIEERTRMALVPMLATGVSPGLLWTTKLMAAFTISLPVVYTALGLDIAMMKWYFGIDPVFNPSILLMAFVIGPFVSLSFLAVMFFLFWTVQAARMLVSFLPMVLTLSIWALLSANPVTDVMLYTVVGAVVGSTALIALCAFGIGRVSRQHLAGL